MAVYKLPGRSGPQNAQHLSMVFARLKATKTLKNGGLKPNFRGFLSELLMRFERDLMPTRMCSAD